MYLIVQTRIFMASCFFFRIYTIGDQTQHLSSPSNSYLEGEDLVIRAGLNVLYSFVFFNEHVMCYLNPNVHGILLWEIPDAVIKS